MSKEVKIGLLAVVTFALSFWGYKFILGKNLFVSSNYYQVLYDHVAGLTVGTRVHISGVDVGGVSSITLLPDERRQVLVLLNLKRSIQIPKDTRAVISPAGVMGGQALNLYYDRPCSGADCLENGGFLKGETQGLLASMMSLDNVQGYLDAVNQALKGMLDTLNQELLSEDSDSPIALSVRDMRSTLSNLNSTTSQLDGLISRSSRNIEGTLANVNALSGTLNSKGAAMGEVVDNARLLSKQLTDAQIDQTLAEVKTAITNLQSVLNKADTAMGGLNGVVTRLEAGEGTLGKLLKDDGLYDDLSSLSMQLDSVMADIQGRPYRYIPFKSRSRVKRYDKRDAEAEN